VKPLTEISLYLAVCYLICIIFYNFYLTCLAVSPAKYKRDVKDPGSSQDLITTTKQ